MLRNDQRVTRNGDVEVFRCLLMFLIVAYHSFIYGPCSASKALWTYCFTVLICWHTDGFLAISGWYGIKFRWSKFFGLIGQFAFYGFLSCAYCWVMGVGFQWGWAWFTGGWFGSTYLVLMLLAPWINRLFETERISLLRFAVVGSLAAVLFASWITGRFGAGMVPVRKFGLHSVLLMVYLYCVARLLRTRLGGRKPRLGILLLGMGLFVLTLPIFHAVDVLHRSATGAGIHGIGAYFAAFDAPHTVLMAFSLLLLFVCHVRLPDWIGRLAIKISPLLFGVYLCHAATSFGARFYDFEGWLVDSLHLHGFFAVLLTAAFVFAAGVGMELIRKGVLFWWRGRRGGGGGCSF